MPVRNSSASASVSACDGSAGTDGTLTVRSSCEAGAKATRSVKVPPVSTPIIHFDMSVSALRLFPQPPMTNAAIKPGKRPVHTSRDKEREDHAEIDVAGIKQRAMI